MTSWNNSSNLTYSTIDPANANNNWNNMNKTYNNMVNTMMNDNNMPSGMPNNMQNFMQNGMQNGMPNSMYNDYSNYNRGDVDSIINRACIKMQQCSRLQYGEDFNSCQTMFKDQYNSASKSGMGEFLLNKLQMYANVPDANSLSECQARDVAMWNAKKNWTTGMN